MARLAGLVVLATLVFALYLRQPAGFGESRLKAAQSLALVCRMMAQDDANGVYPTTRREIDVTSKTSGSGTWHRIFVASRSDLHRELKSIELKELIHGSNRLRKRAVKEDVLESQK